MTLCLEKNGFCFVLVIDCWIHVIRNLYKWFCHISRFFKCVQKLVYAWTECVNMWLYCLRNCKQLHIYCILKELIHRVFKVKNTRLYSKYRACTTAAFNCLACQQYDLLAETLNIHNPLISWFMSTAVCDLVSVTPVCQSHIIGSFSSYK